SCHDCADEQPAEHDGTERLNDRHQDDRNQWQQRWNSHLSQSSFLLDVHASSVLGSILSGQDARFGLQLPAHLAHNSACGLALRVHAEGSEDEWQESADEKSDDDFLIIERELK